MARDRNSDRANLGEQADMSRTEVERQDRTMGASSREDSMAGSEGVEDQALERGNRESLESDRVVRGSERVDADRKSNRGGSRKRSQSGSGRDRQQGRESTDNSGRSFSGQGNQKEGTSEREGTGYTPSEDIDESGGLGGNR